MEDINEIIKEIVKITKGVKSVDDLYKGKYENLYKLVGEFEHKTPCGTRTGAKKELIKQLTGVDVSEYPSVASCETIIEAYVYISKDLDADIRKVVGRDPKVLAYDPKTINKKVDWLKSIGVKNIGKVVEREPKVLTYDPETMDIKVKYLKSIGVVKIGKVVEKEPEVLNYDPETMNKRVDYLKSIGVVKIGKVVEREPEVLNYDPETMNKRVDYLKSIGVVKIGKVVERNPDVLTYDPETMDIRVKYLKSIDIKDIGNVVEREPKVLTNSVKTTKSKVEFLFSKGYSVDGIERCPCALTRSLTEKIMPRIEFLESIGRDPTELSLGSILTPKDKKFSKLFAGNERAYGEFLEKWKAQRLAEYAAEAG